MHPWHASFERGVGAPVPHPVDDHLRFFDEHMLTETTGTWRCATANWRAWLWLRTFVTNTRLQRFHERHGFEPVMQLDDLRHEWKLPR